MDPTQPREALPLRDDHGLGLDVVKHTSAYPGRPA